MRSSLSSNIQKEVTIDPNLFGGYCERGDINAVVSCLMEDPSVLNTSDRYGIFPLHWAVKSGNPSLVGLLVSKGADINAEIDPAVFIDANIECLREDIVINPLKCSQMGTALHWACYLDQAEIVSLLMTLGASHNIYDNKGMYPIHTAAVSGNQTCLKALLEEKIDIDCQDSYGFSPIRLAACIGDTFFVAMLFEHGARDWQEVEGEESLTLSRIERFKGFFDSRLEFDKNASFLRLEHPIVSACRKNHIEMVQLIWKLHPSFKSPDRHISAGIQYFISYLANECDDQPFIFEIVQSEWFKQVLVSNMGLVLDLISKNSIMTSYVREKLYPDSEFQNNLLAEPDAVVKFIINTGDSKLFEILIEKIPEEINLDLVRKLLVKASCGKDYRFKGIYMRFTAANRISPKLSRPSFFRETRLFLACLNRDSALVESCIDSGASYSLNKINYAAILLAIRKDYWEIVRCLWQSNAFKKEGMEFDPPHLKDQFFQEIFLLAYENRAFATMRVLAKDRGRVDINFVYLGLRRTETLLSRARHKIDLDMFERLVELGANVQYLPDNHELQDLLTFRENDANTLFSLVDAKRRSAKNFVPEVNAISMFINIYLHLPKDLQQYVFLFLAFKSPIFHKSTQSFTHSKNNAFQFFKKLTERSQWYKPKSESTLNKIIDSIKKIGRN